MTTSERVHRNMQRDKPMTDLSFQVPQHVIDDLKEVAEALGYSNYQALVRAYLSVGLREDLLKLDKKSARNTAVQEFSHRLNAHGVSQEAGEDVIADMRKAS